MPLYEYECDACGGRFEVIQKFSETAETCRRCGKGPVRRLLSPPAIQFKGSGWYITDYAQKGKSGSDTTAAGDAPAEKKPDAAKTETSPKSDPAPAPSASSSTTSSKD